MSIIRANNRSLINVTALPFATGGLVKLQTTDVTSAQATVNFDNTVITDTYDKYDIGITYDDEDSPYRIKFWGKNITDQHEVANGTGGLVYMYNPRHYGMTVSAKF